MEHNIPTMRSLALILILAAGCSEELPSTLGELKDVAAKARDEAADARNRKDPKAARAASERAAAALTAAEALPQGPEVGDIRLASQAAARSAALCAEEKARDDAVSGLKVRAYRAARSTALAAFFKGLALAADQAGRGTPDELPEAVGKAAQEAARISGRPALPDGSTDWPGVSADLSAMANEPPAEIGFWLAVAFTLAGKTDLALVELEALDPAKLPEDRRMVFWIVRHYVYSSRGWTLLAADQLGAFEPQAEGTPELIAMGHIYLAYAAIRERDYARADSHIARTLVLWPNNPVAVMLTGERLAADGNVEEAAQSLQKAAADTEHQWIAERIARRARDLRDGKNLDQALLVDPPFLTEVALHLVAQAAKRSPQAEKAVRWVENARAIGRKVIDAVP
jgi:tetratricopeptide (TPR) repeat protein